MNAPTIPAVAIDLATIKRRQQVAWGSGDYVVIGTTLQIVGALLDRARERAKAERLSVTFRESRSKKPMRKLYNTFG
jgi:hypothetical protein